MTPSAMELARELREWILNSDKDSLKLFLTSSNKKYGQDPPLPLPWNDNRENAKNET
jgi:hypothetical protein